MEAAENEPWGPVPRLAPASDGGRRQNSRPTESVVEANPADPSPDRARTLSRGVPLFFALVSPLLVSSASDGRPVLDAGAVAVGVAAQWLHVAGLYVATPLEGARVGSLVLVLATGLVGGVVAGDRAGPPTARSGRHGLAAGLLGGTGTAGFFWLLLATPGAPRGAFRSLAFLVATSQIPGIRTRGNLVVGLLAVLLAATLAALGWVAGRRAPDRAESIVE